MNETLSLLYSHRSDRNFSDEPVSDEAVCTILEAARRAPTSSNAQHISMVVVRDPVRRARIAELAGGKQAAQETMEGLLAGVIDAGIALATTMAAARSLGLGIVPIGGIRRNPQGMIDLLELPPHSFPVVGLSVGHIAKPAQQKPRLSMETFRHDERYHREGMKEAIVAYDAVLLDYWRHIGRSDGQAWSKNTAEYYARMTSRPVKLAMTGQGLTPDK